MRKHKILYRSLIFLMVAMVLLPLGQPVVVLKADAKVTQAQIDALKDDASDLASQKKDIQNQLKDIRNDKKQVVKQKDLLEDQIDVIQAEIDNIQAQIEGYESMIDLKNQELEENQAREREQYELFCRRIRSMEEEGEQSYWAILFSSGSFSELLDNFMMVEEIIQYDNGIMDSLLQLRQQLEQAKADLETAKSGEEEAKAAQESARQELANQEQEVAAVIREISAQEDVLEDMEAELNRAAKEMDAEIKKLEKEMAAQIKNVPSESGFLWPLDASINVLSSLYGGRIHPVTKKPSNHGGIDIPAAKNTPIYASKSGVVTTSVKQGTYGNYVVVSHSDGTSTLYAHMNKRAVSKGQTVKQGQVIGYVGTTGRSTGNHLHFEIRVNGDRRDPIDYFKDKTLYAKSGGKTALLKH